MQSRRTRRRHGNLRRHLYLIVPLAVLAALVFTNLRAPWIAEGLRLHIFDSYQRIAPRPYTPLPVKIVDVDEESLSKLGQWPWPRTYVARLIRKLHAAGASAIVLDLIFAERDRTAPSQIFPIWNEQVDLTSIMGPIFEVPDPDAELASAILEAQVVTGFVLTHGTRDVALNRKAGFEAHGVNPWPFVPQFSRSLQNLESLDAGAPGQGAFNIVPDRDGINRRMHLMYRLNNDIFPALSAETLRVAQGAPRYVVRSLGATAATPPVPDNRIDELKIGDLVVPTDEQGRLWLHFTRPEQSRYLSAWKVLDDAFDDAILTGSIVFIGTSAVGLKDIRATPLNPVAPGVEIHASAVEQMLLGHYLQRPSWAEPAELAYIVVLAIVLMLLLPRVSAVASGIVGAVAAMVAAGGSWFAYTELQWLVDPVLPSATVLVLFLVGTFINFVQTEAARKQVRNAFNHYLAPPIIDAVMSDPEKLERGGERRETTFLFTDLAGFATLSEDMAPDDLVRLLNEYFDGTCAIILDSNGTIDKIVGDALHVMFNAPVDQADHAERAVKCAIRLDEFCTAFRERKNAEGIELGVTRIGINTGATVVGNFGGTSRFDYTAHGDAINTAARLESANKHFGTRICVSQSTRDRCSEQAQFRPIGNVQLKGKSRYVMVFEPVTDAAEPRVKRYMAAYELMELDDETTADDLTSTMTDLSEEFPDDPLFDLHRRRLERGESGSTFTLDEK